MISRQLNEQKIHSRSIFSILVAPVVFILMMFFQLSQNKIDVSELTVSIIIALLSIIILYFEINRYEEWTKQMVITSCFLGIGSLLLLLTIQTTGQQLSTIYYVTPIAAYAILTKYLISERFAIISAIIMSIFGATIFTVNDISFLPVFIYFLMSQWFAIYFYQSIKDRKTLIKMSSTLTTIHFLLVISFELILVPTLNTTQIIIALSLACLSVFIAVILTLGLLPLFEAGFNVLTESKLLTLSNPNHPLLRKLLVEAPGTYHHSVMVANLSESACEAIGANGLLARVASYYHDVGKALEPHMFIENQHGKNPHDEMSPEESAQIILRHPYTGARLLREYSLPEEIVQIAEQHHGTTLLKYFYHKAKSVNPNVKESQFRYNGPIPQSKEAAIINICDSVEAAVRSKDKPTNGEIHNIVRSIIYDRLMDGQLNDCGLTLNDLLVIEKDICDMLNGIFHERIEYPEQVTSQ